MKCVHPSYLILFKRKKKLILSEILVQGNHGGIQYKYQIYIISMETGDT